MSALGLTVIGGRKSNGNGGGPPYDDTALKNRVATAETDIDALEAQSVTVPACLLGTSGVKLTDLATDYVTLDIFSVTTFRAGTTSLPMKISGDAGNGVEVRNFQVLPTTTIGDLMSRIQTWLRSSPAFATVVFAVVAGTIVLHLGDDVERDLGVTNPLGNFGLVGTAEPVENASAALRQLVISDAAQSEDIASLHVQADALDEEINAASAPNRVTMTAVALTEATSGYVSFLSPLGQTGVYLQPGLTAAEVRTSLVGHLTDHGAEVLINGNSITADLAEIQVTGDPQVVAALSIVNIATPGGVKARVGALETLTRMLDVEVIDIMPAQPAQMSSINLYEPPASTVSFSLAVDAGAATDIEIVAGSTISDAIAQILTAVGPSVYVAEDAGHLVIRTISGGIYSEISITNQIGNLFANGTAVGSNEVKSTYIEQMTLIQFVEHVNSLNRKLNGLDP